MQTMALSKLPRTGNAGKGCDQGQKLDRVGGYPVGRNYDMMVNASGRPIAVICRIKATGKILFITTYLLE